MGFTKELVEDRSKIPDLEEPELIQGKPFNLSKFGIPIVAVLTAVVAFFGGLPKLNDDQDTAERMVIIGGIYLVLALIPIALAIVFAADYRARALATSANFALRAASDRPPATLPSTASPRGLAATGVRMSIAAEDEDYELVLAVEQGPSPEAMPRYLVGKQGTNRPHFITQDQILAVKYEVDPQTLRVPS